MIPTPGPTRQAVPQPTREVVPRHLSLISPSGGWIGTVAHIVGAEAEGPRGKSPMTPEERASATNLMLMCATHGREVDAPDTGEKNFPVDRLQVMKETHEAKISEAVAAAIEQEMSGAKTATGVIDTSLRKATAATTAEGLLESLILTEPSTAAEMVVALDEVRARLQRLSQPALDTLSQLLRLWFVQCRNPADNRVDFGDPSGVRPSVPFQSVDNRIMRGMQSSFDSAKAELESHELLSVEVDEYAGTAEYIFESPWSFHSGAGARAWRYDFWISTAEFLHAGHGIECQGTVGTAQWRT